MSILDHLKINTEVFSAFVNEPEILAPTSTTTMLRVGKPVPYKATINSVKLDATVTLQEASLTRLSVLKQQQRSTGEWYYIMTGILNPVKLDIDLMINGDFISLVELFHQIAEESAGREMTIEQFMYQAKNIGFDFENGMPLFFQQMGIDLDKFHALVDVFTANGAKDVIGDIKNNRNIEGAWALKDGLPVTAFEVGTTDRAQSARFKHDGVGQGFQDLVSASFDQFTRIVGLRKSAAVHEAQAQAAGVSETDVIKHSTAAKEAITMSNMAKSNWAGAQRRLERQPNGSFLERPIYDPVNLPCGRLTIVTNDGTYEADVWGNRKNKTVTVPTAKPDAPEELF